MNNINEELKTLATNVEELSGSLGTTAYDGITDIVKNLHSEYDTAAKNDDKQTRDKSLANLNGVVAKVDSMKQTNINMATAINNGDLSNWNEEDSISDNRDLFKSFLGGKAPLSSNEEGDIGIKHNGKFYTNSEVDKMLSDSKKDFSSIKDLRQHVIDATALGKEDKGLNGATTNGFNVENTRAQILDTVKKGNTKSLLFDSILDGRPMVDEIADMPELKGIRYADLGLKPPKNDNDGMMNETLTPSDARKIAASLAEEGNAEIAQELITNYMTSIIQKNNDKARQDPPKPSDSMPEVAGMSAQELIEKYRRK